MRNILHMLEITQPIGTFYVGKIESDKLIKIAETRTRDNNSGIQRELRNKRVEEIAKYCEDPDATFPTPIILEIKSRDVISICDNEYIDGMIDIEFDDTKCIAEILDGQHRVQGIKAAKNSFELMIVVMFDLTEEEKAYVFSTINSNQKNVDKSLIFDLFELSEDRSPYKTCHEIARIMNADGNSPFYKKLKMLGKKDSEHAILSQGTFVNYLCRLISSQPQKDMIDIKKGLEIEDNSKLVLRRYFKDNRDDILLKLMYNYFNAVQSVFFEEWRDSKNYILSKTTGYGALMKAFSSFYRLGFEKKDLSQQFFESELLKVKKQLEKENIQLTSNSFQSGEQGQKSLEQLLIKNL